MVLRARRGAWAAVAALVAMLLSIGGGVLLSPGTASAVTSERDAATRGTPGGTCSYIRTTRQGTACFIKYGDVWWLMDDWTSPWDGAALYVQWVNQLKDSGGHWADYRSGECYVIPNGNLDHSSYCNKDYYENTTKNTWGGVGSRIAFKACTEALGCSALSSWIYNDQ